MFGLGSILYERREVIVSEARVVLCNIIIVSVLSIATEWTYSQVPGAEFVFCHCCSTCMYVRHVQMPSGRPVYPLGWVRMVFGVKT